MPHRHSNSGRLTGETGTALAPNNVVWIVDPEHEGGVAAVAQTQLRASLFHELHHLVRDAHVPRSTLIDVAVTEGMATVFERDFAQASPAWGWYPADADAWVAELERVTSTAERRPWLFHHPDGRRWIAFKAGAYLVDRAQRPCGKSAAELVTMPTAGVMALAHR